ncbi:VOC family protein [Lysobacter koreensis]|uniref:VOC family protein n=1 Tax=Lysobacter koreensis TaxID=266122 RepID=A0ABW2YTV5_9GAMM
MAVKSIPDGYHAVTPYLIVDDANAAIDFYARAFGAQELYRLPMTDKDGVAKVGHAEIRIGDCNLMLSDEWPDMQALGPKARGGATASFVIYGDDADAAFERAVKAGARVDRPVQDQFWGDRMGTVVDPFGHKWTLGTHVEDVSPEEMQKRMAAWAEQESS